MVVCRLHCVYTVCSHIIISLFLLLLETIMTEKRKRSPNWMVSEKTLLLDIVQKHLSIIENKKIDGAAIKRKTDEWINIRDKYNSQTKYPEHCHRTAANLKAQWESMKKAVKKKSSIQKQLAQTGGIPLKMNMEDPFYNRVLNLIDASVIGMKNQYNNNNLDTRAENQNTFSELTEEFVELESQDIGHFKVLKVESLLSASTISPVSVEDSDSNNYTPHSMQKPVSKNLRVEERINCMPKRNGTNERKRQFSNNSYLTQAKNIHDLNIQIKEEELKLKKEEVKQSKIKTRLLLLELKLKRRMLVRDQVH